ncbi:replication initiation protein [Clostridium botulinum]|uniref:replication initiation protein n=1 Tax=Clostridium botulinum TaxID=1491 RepID=UPI0004DAC90C|nr:replication initiation protein [Clostridium botulinum]KEH90388.1 replication protein [Clostridium botulinum C/D str. It1]
MDQNYLVTKSNFFIMNSSYDLSLEEQKIILTLASMVQPSDEEFKPYFFKVSDFIKLLGIKNKSQYREVPKLTKELMKKVFEIRQDKKILQVAWLSSAEYEEGSGLVELQFSPKLKPYMLKLNKLYTSYKLANILSMKSKYSPRVYEILKCNEFKKEKYIEIEIEILRKLLKAENIYPRYNDFKRFILAKAQKELNKLTDISFEFEEIKTGRKVTTLRFYIESKEIQCKDNDIIKVPELIENSQEVKQDETSITIDEVDDMTEESKESDETIFIKNLFDNKLSDIDCTKILAVAKGDLDKIKEAYNIAMQQPKINNLCGFIIACIKDNYTVPITITNINKNEQVDMFNNYEQRQYDWPDLEKKLLGWDSEESNNINPKEELQCFLDSLQENGIDGKPFRYYTIDFDTYEIPGTLKGDLVAFKFKIENNIISLIDPRINKVIASKK